MLKAGVPRDLRLFLRRARPPLRHAGRRQSGGSAFAYGPGEQGYVNQLKQYDAAFGTFFTNLAAAGIDKSNTLFVILVEEGDQFAGGTPTPATCDGVTTPCTYPPNNYTGGRPAKGEVDINLDTLLLKPAWQQHAFQRHTDQAPAFYLNTNPTQSASLTRTFEHDLAALKYQNPYENDRSPPDHQPVRRPGGNVSAPHGHRRSAAHADARCLQRSGRLFRYRRRHQRIQQPELQRRIGMHLRRFRLEPRLHGSGSAADLDKHGRSRHQSCW
ncbi:MAG: hypothetical protein WDN04_10135 [Rhodospirillales bacterium]